MSTREEIRKQILGIDNLLSGSYGLSQETIENLEKDKQKRQAIFQQMCDDKIEEIFNAIEVMESLQKNSDPKTSENYSNSIEGFKGEIAQIEGELQDMKLSTAKIQEWGNRRQEKETGETEKEEPQTEQQNPEQSGQEDKEAESVVISEQENKVPETAEKQPRQSRSRLVRAFQSLVAKLGKILGIRKGIEAELEARNIDLSKINAEELENKTQEVEQGTSQQPEPDLPINEAENQQDMQPEQVQQDAAEPEKTTQTQSPKQTIIGRFKQIMTYRARVRALEKSINKQLRKRNLEHWIEDKKEMAHKKWENAKDSVVHSKVVQGANDIKDRVTDKKVWLEQNMSDTKEKVVESAKETGTIVLAFGVMSIEAIGKAREAFQAVSAQTIQNVVNYGRDTANAVLDKFQENVQTREEKVLEKSEKTKKSEMMEDYLEMA